MFDNYSFAKHEQYGGHLATRLCDQYFGSSHTTTLDGPAALSFAPIRQLTPLVVPQLLHQWQTEASA